MSEASKTFLRENLATSANEASAGESAHETREGGWNPYEVWRTRVFAPQPKYPHPNREDTGRRRNT